MDAFLGYNQIRMDERDLSPIKADMAIKLCRLVYRMRVLHTKGLLITCSNL